jgi:hypothetical protein
MRHEETSELGWLLYLVHQQDEEQQLEMISSLLNEYVGAKWRPIHCNDRNKKAAKDTAP